MIAMEGYIRQIEPHFHQHLDKAYRDVWKTNPELSIHYENQAKKESK
jgi:hypothetical protein